MLTETSLATKTDGPLLVPAYAVGTRKTVQTAKRKTVPKHDANSQSRWIEDLIAIKDNKDQDAFARVFSHFAPRVKGFLIKSGATSEMAEECAQDVMATLWRKAHLYDPSKASPSTWIFTIARNRQIDMIRRARRPEPEDLPWGPEDTEDPNEAFALQEETERLGKALAELPEKQRDLIQRAYFGDLSHNEIAEQTGLPLGTIKSRIRLALDRLRHSMK